MSTFEYLKTGEALMNARDDAPEYKRIKGLKAINADRLPFMTRTRAGNMRQPVASWDAHNHVDKMREIDRIEMARDADRGVIEVFFTDGTTDLVRPEDLLCVERPILIES